MKKREKYVLGGLALAALVGGGLYLAMHPKASTPTGGGGALTQGTVYTIASTLPAGITDAQALATQLVAAGWSGVKVWAFNGQGANLTGIVAPSGGYIATATWNQAGAALPAGVMAVAGDLGTPTGATPLATA